MIKRMWQYLWSLRIEFTKYFLVGISGVVLDMATLILFKEIFGWLPITAVLINQFIVLWYIFLLNKYWSFQDKSMPHKQFIRYMIVFAFNYITGIATMYAFNQLLEFDYRIVRLVTIALSVSWNFFLYKYWVYIGQNSLK